MYTCDRCGNRLIEGESGICEACKHDLVEAKQDLEEYGKYLD